MQKEKEETGCRKKIVKMYCWKPMPSGILPSWRYWRHKQLQILAVKYISWGAHLMLSAQVGPPYPQGICSQTPLDNGISWWGSSEDYWKHLPVISRGVLRPSHMQPLKHFPEVLKRYFRLSTTFRRCSEALQCKSGTCAESNLRVPNCR